MFIISHTNVVWCEFLHYDRLPQTEMSSDGRCRYVWVVNASGYLFTQWSQKVGFELIFGNIEEYEL